jgi:hypothetical protein
LILGLAITAWGVLGALLLPGYFRAQLERFVAQNSRGSLTIGRLTVNPFILAAGIHDFTLVGPERDTLLAAKAFTLDASITSIFRRGIVLDRIALVGPEVHLTVLPDGRLDWMRLVAPGHDSTQVATTTPASKPPSVRITRLSLEGGRLLFHDLSRPDPYSATISPINLNLEHFSTAPNEKGDHSFTASLVEGGTLHWQGGFSVEPFGATGRIEVDSLSARALWRWLHSELKFELPEGRLFFSLPYTFTTAGNTTRLVLHNGTLRATGVRIVDPGVTGDVVAVPSLAVDSANVDFAGSSASIARIHAEGAKLQTSLSPDTVFNLARLFEPRNPPKPVPNAAPMPEWRVKLDRFDVSGVAVTFTDSTQWPPPSLDFDELGFEARGLDSGRDLSGLVSARTRMEGTGTLGAEGHASLAPTFVDLAIHAERVPLRPVQAYLDTFIKLDVVRGTADLQGHMQAGLQDDGQLTFKLRADGRVRDLAAADSASGADFLRVKEADVKGIEMDMGPDRFQLRSLQLTRPSATVALGTDASLNLFRIFPSLVPPPPGTEVKSVPFQIDRIRVRNGTMRFVDQTIAPPYVTRVDSIAGEIANLSSSPTAEAHITLAGKADGNAPAKLDARLRPADKEPYAVFTLGLSSYEMTAFTPYVGKYIGHLVDRGQMSLDLDYRIADRKLKGQNDALLDQFTLGDKTHSRDATKLPVGLALAVLRDRDGKIKLDIPVQGDLDDPHFGIGSVILHALLNLVTKIALSPFALLGKLIPGGGDESVGDIAFAPGADTLDADQVAKVGKLVEALGERPGLRLYVSGAADSVVDRASLARVSLETRIARQRRAEFFAASVPEPERAVEAPAPEGERARALAKLYLKTFGKDSVGATLPDPELSKGDLRRVAKMAVSGKTSERPTWPPKTSFPAATAARLEDRLLVAAVVTTADLQHLAEARGEALKHQLVDVRGMAEERVFLKGASLSGGSSHQQVACKLDLSE